MTCPICDQKPMNCDCTAFESELADRLQDIEDAIGAVGGIVQCLANVISSVEEIVDEHGNENATVAIKSAARDLEGLRKRIS